MLKKTFSSTVGAAIVVLAIPVLGMAAEGGRDYSINQSETQLYGEPATAPFATNTSAGYSNIEYLGSCLWANPTDIVVEGAYAYCAFPNGLEILDVTNPTQPTLVSQVYLPDGYPDSKGQLEKAGNYVYIARYARDSGLAIIDVADPMNPFVATMYPFRLASNVALCDSLVFIYSWLRQRLDVLNIANPLTPDALTSITLASSTDLFAMDTLLLVGRYNDLRIYDVSDPSAMDSIGVFQFSIERGAKQVYALDTIAYVIDGLGNYHALDISNPALPTHISSSLIQGNANDLHVVDTLAYILNRAPQGLHILNVKDPAAPNPVGSFVDTAGVMNSVHVEGSTAYIANRYNGIQTLDVGNTANPVPLGGYNTILRIRDFCVLDSFAYVACMSDGLQIVNINEPTSPIVVGSYTISDALNVQAVDSLVYVATEVGLTILNTIDPANPDSIGAINIGARLLDVLVVDSLAYTTANQSGLYIIDVGDPTSPTEIGHWDSTVFRSVSEVEVVDSLAYLADDEGLVILSVADPANPLFVSFLQTSQEEYTRSLAVQDTIVYLGLESVGFWVVNVVDPAAPDTIAWYDKGDDAEGLFLRDSLLYIASYNEGMEIVNIADPANPAPFGRYDTPGYASDVFVRDSVVYVADGFSFIILNSPLDFTVGVDDEPETDLLPTGFEVSQNYPNPFNPTTTIPYSLSQKAKVEVTVYNILGETVRSFPEGMKSAGEHTVIWNGVDEAGKSVASGIYFYRIKAGELTSSRKMILLK